MRFFLFFSFYKSKLSLFLKTFHKMKTNQYANDSQVTSVTREYIVGHEAGLHLRLTSQIASYTSNVEGFEFKLSYEDKEVQASSVLGIMTLGVSSGEKVIVSAKPKPGRTQKTGELETHLSELGRLISGQETVSEFFGDKCFASA